MQSQPQLRITYLCVQVKPCRVNNFYVHSYCLRYCQLYIVVTDPSHLSVLILRGSLKHPTIPIQVCRAIDDKYIRITAMSMSKLLTTHNIIDNSYRNKLKNNRYVCLCSLSNSVASTIIRRNGHLALSALLHNKKSYITWKRQLVAIVEQYNY